MDRGTYGINRMLILFKVAEYRRRNWSASVKATQRELVALRSQRHRKGGA